MEDNERTLDAVCYTFDPKANSLIRNKKIKVITYMYHNPVSELTL